MSDVTQILKALNETGSGAEELLPLVYEELRSLAASKMAREAPGQTLQATALVHEAWLRVSNGDNEWENRGHFFAAAAEAMRRILVDNARRKKALKHGGQMERVNLEGINVVAKSGDDELIAVHEVLDALEREDAGVAELVKLRFFAGLNIDEAALALDISRSTAKRHWNYARAWLYRAIKPNR
jgi:RNA polymerase sigma factor (TIGR02999 family)